MLTTDSGSAFFGMGFEHPTIRSILIGVLQPKQLDENIAAVELKLTSDEVNAAKESGKNCGRRDILRPIDFLNVFQRVKPRTVVGIELD